MKSYHLGKDLFISVKPYRKILPKGIDDSDMVYYSDNEKYIIYNASDYVFDPEIIFNFDGHERTTYSIKFTDEEVKTMIGVFKKLRLPWYKRWWNFLKKSW